MESIAERIQHADWKTEKHVPVITCPDRVKADEAFEVRVEVGVEVAHPNTTEHHIRWISLQFLPEGSKFIHDIASFEFNSHGEAVEGPNEGPAYTHPLGITSLRIKEPGTLFALSYCNIHGLWESSKEIALE